MSQLTVQDNDAYTIVRDPRGRIIYITADSAALLPTVDFPSGTLAWIPSEGKHYLLSSGSWAVFNFSQANGTLSGTLDVAGVSTLTGLVTGTAGFDGPLAAGNTVAATTNGVSMIPWVRTEEIDLGGEDENAAKNSAANMILANSVVFGVSKWVTETFAGDMANYDIGDESTPTRFVTDSTDTTAGDNDFHNEDGIVLDLAASDIEVLLNDAATAGKLRISVYGIQFVLPTS